MRYPAAFSSLLLLPLAFPAAAMVGNAPVADPALARHIVMIVGSGGNFCTATAIARDLVFTAAHCLHAGADYKVLVNDAAGAPQFADVVRVARHPQFSQDTFLNHRATADVALIKLARPLAAAVVPATLGDPAAVAPGDRLTIAGFGLSVPGDGRSGGVARAATLTVTGQPGLLQIRLFDPATRGERPGLGACTGDSGAPLFALPAGRPAVIGVVSWTTGPQLSDGCGGLTGVTPLARYKDWVVKAARDMGSPLP
jgi:secreted trypsin-like serine protease